MEAIGKIRLKKTVLFEDCEDMRLYDYIQITEKGNLYHLVKSGKYPKKELLLERMEAINKEFADMRGENNMVVQFDKISYKEELVLQVHFGAAIIDILQTQVTLNIIASETFNNLISELKSWGFRINEDEPLIDELIKVKNEIEALQATIESIEEELHPTVEENEIEASERGNPAFNLTSLLLIYARILNQPAKSSKEINLVEFAVMEKQVKTEQEKAAKNNAA